MARHYDPERPVQAKKFPDPDHSSKHVRRGHRLQEGRAHDAKRHQLARIIIE